MSYYKGKHLQQQIKRFGLETLYDLLKQIAAEKGVWPDTCTVTPPDPGQEEPLRVTLYSILHELGLKPYFSVKSLHGDLILDSKGSVGNKAGLHFGPRFAAAGTEQNPDNLPPLGDEGYIALLEGKEDD